jgi:hypothetical protein
MGDINAVVSEMLASLATTAPNSPQAGTALVVAASAVIATALRSREEATVHLFNECMEDCHLLWRLTELRQ